MLEFAYPLETNNKCWIKSLSYECKDCNSTFLHSLPLDGYDAVKLIEEDGTNVKWLPLNGIGGYLDLANKIAPELATKFNGTSDAISMQVSKVMNIELPRYTEKGPMGNGYIVGGYDQKCPYCKSQNLKLINETVIENPKLDWVKISCDLLK